MRDPYARLTRRQRWQSAAWRLRRRLAGTGGAARRPAGDGPPHLLLLGVDTLRADHLGCYGYARGTSPRLDALAGGGALLADVMAPAPWTLPSFSGALTGLMPGLHGAYLGGAVRNMDHQAPGRLRPEAVTLAAHLRRHGYRTAAFYANQFFAFGLAESFERHQYANLPAADLVTMAADWLRRHGDAPCFCFVLLNDPHEPTTPSPADLAPFLPSPPPASSALSELARWGGASLPHLGRAGDPRHAAVAAARDLKLSVYDATIHQVDRAIGWLQDRLQDDGLADRTLVTVFSDHGEEFLDHADWAARWDHDPRGLRGIGHGQSHFQELLHVPWISWGPGVPQQARYAAPASLLDLSPTLLEWLGLPPLPAFGPLQAGAQGWPPELTRALTGRSLAAAVAADPGAAAGAAAGDAPDGAGRLRLAEAIAYGPDLVALRRGTWKLIASRDGRPLALFELREDPGEQTDRAADRPEILEPLLALAASWCASGLGAHDHGRGGAWSELDDTVRDRLRDLGYSD